MAWLEAITNGREWVEPRDAPRIRRAFVTLAQTRESWPAPRHFIEALPPPDAQLRLPGEGERPADPPELRRELHRIETGYYSRKDAAAGDGARSDA